MTGAGLRNIQYCRLEFAHRNTKLARLFPLMPLKPLPLALGFLALTAARLSASMIDEIQVYTFDINPVGKFGLELHLNSTFKGRTLPDYPGEITPQHGIRLTPEFSYGLTHDFEVGLYVPMQRTPAGANDLAGAKLRLKWLPVQPDEKKGGWFAGANVELSRLNPRFEEGRWSTELRTMIGYRDPEWLLAANPVLGWTLAGPDRSARPEAELQVKASREIAKGIAIGPEYYAGFGPLGRTPGFAAQDHSLFLAFDIDREPWVFNFGIGRGLSRSADRWTVKFIFEVPW